MAKTVSYDPTKKFSTVNSLAQQEIRQERMKLGGEGSLGDEMRSLTVAIAIVALDNSDCIDDASRNLKGDRWGGLLIAHVAQIQVSRFFHSVEHVSQFVGSIHTFRPVDSNHGNFVRYWNCKRYCASSIHHSI